MTQRKNGGYTQANFERIFSQLESIEEYMRLDAAWKEKQAERLATLESRVAASDRQNDDQEQRLRGMERSDRRWAAAATLTSVFGALGLGWLARRLGLG